MQRKSLLYSLLLCLVFMISAACSPAAGPDDDRQKYQTFSNRLYNQPAGPYDDDRGFKNDFSTSDLNPNMVTGTNDLFNINADEEIIAGVAATVPGVKNVRTNIIGGTARVTVKADQNADLDRIQSLVHERVQFKMPRYNVVVRVRPGA